MGKALSQHREQQVQRHWGREDDWERFKEEQTGQCGWNTVSKKESKRQLDRVCRGMGRSCLPKVTVEALAFTLKELGRHKRLGAERQESDYI